MDVRTYATVTTVCTRLAGRLPDDAMDAARVDYACGEPAQAEAALLLTLAHEQIGITREERALIASTLPDPSELADVPQVEEPPLRHRFTTPPPENIPADTFLASEAPRYGGRALHRTRRTPLTGDAPATWLYVLTVSPATDILAAYAGLTSRLWVTRHERWPLEVLPEHTDPPPYHAAAFANAREIWST